MGRLIPTSRLKFEASVDFNRQSTDDFPDVQYGPNSIIYNLAIWTGADWSVNSPDIKAIWQPGKVNVQSEFEEYTRYHNPYFLTKIWTRGHYKNDVYGYIDGSYKIDNHLKHYIKEPDRQLFNCCVLKTCHILHTLMDAKAIWVITGKTAATCLKTIRY